MDAKQYEADIQYKGSFITECSFDNNIIDAVTNCELTHQIIRRIKCRTFLLMLYDFPKNKKTPLEVLHNGCKAV